MFNNLLNKKKLKKQREVKKFDYIYVFLYRNINNLDMVRIRYNFLKKGLNLFLMKNNFNKNYLYKNKGTVLLAYSNKLLFYPIITNKYLGLKLLFFIKNKKYIYSNKKLLIMQKNNNLLLSLKSNFIFLIFLFNRLVTQGLEYTPDKCKDSSSNLLKPIEEKIA